MLFGMFKDSGDVGDRDKRDIAAAGSLVIASASGIAVPVSKPLTPAEVRELAPPSVVAEAAAARRRAGVA